MSLRSWGKCGSGAFRYTYLTLLIIHIFYPLNFPTERIQLLPDKTGNQIQATAWALYYDYEIICYAFQGTAVHSLGGLILTGQCICGLLVPSRYSHEVILGFRGMAAKAWEEWTIYNSSKERAF